MIYDFVFLSARRRRINKNACRFGWSKWVDTLSLDLLSLNKMSRFLTSSVHTQAVTAKMFKEGMRIEAIHVKKWVNLVGFHFYITCTSKSSFSRELMGEKKHQAPRFFDWVTSPITAKAKWASKNSEKANPLKRGKTQPTKWYLCQFPSDWLRAWGEFYRPITEHS